MIKVVLDTNVLINADRGEFSYPKRILDLVLTGQIRAIITHQVRQENQLLVERLINDERLKRSIMSYLSMATVVKPVKVKVEIDDHEDIKLLAAVMAGEADWLITDDRHLLDVGHINNSKIATPADFWAWWQNQDSQADKTWQEWAKNLFRH
ncbi:MAG: putative toxin-antitoxin system toxin component, PIN family [Patescibacteria group bacterium]